MKLTEKYELVEPITRGRINSFVARDLSTSEQALVHLFECAGTHAGQPAALWVLQAFRCLAPSPPGLVIEAGTSETSSLAYVITRMPSSAALRAWVQAYKLSTETTQEFDEGKDGTTAALGDVMRQVVEENVQACSEQPSQAQTQLSSEPTSPTASPAGGLHTQQSRGGRQV
jgi:hypothetical protein